MAPLKVNVCRSSRASMVLTASAVDSRAIIAETWLLGKAAQREFAALHGSAHNLAHLTPLSSKVLRLPLALCWTIMVVTLRARAWLMLARVDQHQTGQ
jgi:hypothetical protein